MTNDDAKKYDPGLAHLRKALRVLITAENATQIKAFDGEETTWWGADESGICKVADMAAEIDGIVTYTVGNCSLQVIYDGPYSEDSAAEIINDCNGAAWAHIEGMTL